MTCDSLLAVVMLHINNKTNPNPNPNFNPNYAIINTKRDVMHFQIDPINILVV